MVTQQEYELFFGTGNRALSGQSLGHVLSLYNFDIHPFFVSVSNTLKFIQSLLAGIFIWIVLIV